MIIVFLKYASVHKVPEPKQAKQAEKPAASKEIATEVRAVQDGGIQTVFPSAEAHLGESLGWNLERKSSPDTPTFVIQFTLFIPIVL